MSRGQRWRAQWVVLFCCAVSTTATTATTAADAAEDLYRPQFLHAPPARVGLASRGALEALRLFVLAPDQKGATATLTPSLCWFLSADSSQPLEIVVQQLGADRPLLEHYRATAGAAGSHCIDLADEGVSLEEGTEYLWSVALILDPTRRASDLFSMGSIEFVPPPSSMQVSSAGESAIRDRLSRGYWYDAIAIIEQSLAENPDAASIRALREAVLASQQLVIR